MENQIWISDFPYQFGLTRFVQAIKLLRARNLTTQREKGR